MTTTFKVWCWEGAQWQVSPRCVSCKEVGIETDAATGRNLKVLEIVTTNAAQLAAHMDREPSVQFCEVEGENDEHD